MAADDREFKRTTFAFKADKVTDSGTFSGYASVFGNVDSYGEIVMPGAFADSIKRIKASGDPLPVLWQHRGDQPIGGSDDLSEDSHGLKTSGFLMIDEVPLAKQAHAMLRRRVVRGLSIGYYVEESKYVEPEGVRELHKLDLVEYSVVTFPANVLAGVDSVKSILRDGTLPTMKAFEDFLRESGFSKTQAAAIASGGLSKLLKRSESAEVDAKAIGDVLAGWKVPTLNI